MKNLGNLKVIKGLIILFICLTIVLSTVVLFESIKKTENYAITTEDAELDVTRNYDLFEDGEENIANTDNVKFSAFFLRDIDGDGYAEKIKGTCREIGQQDTLYMEIIVQTEGYLEDAKIVFDAKNFGVLTSLPEDNEILTNYISNNTREIKFKRLNSGTQKLLMGKVRCNNGSSDGTDYAIGNSINNYSRNDNKVILTGTYVDERGNRKNISKEINLSIDWHGTVRAGFVNNSSYGNLSSRIDREKNELDLSFSFETQEFEKKLILHSNYIKGTIPEFNGYAPIEVSYNSTNGIFTYDEETRTFEIIRKAEVNANGTMSKRVGTYNSYSLKVIYPLEAYPDYEPNDIYIDVPMETYYEGYNNPNIEFQNPYKSNTANIKKRIHFYNYIVQPVVCGGSVKIGEEVYSPKRRSIIKKEKPIRIYTGESSEESEDYYNVVWNFATHSDSFDKVILDDGDRSDIFIKNDSTAYSLENISKNVAVWFDVKNAVEEDGWIRLYDKETENLLLELNSSNFTSYTKSQPFYFENPVKHIRVETSRMEKNKYLSINFIKELDDTYITDNISREEFDSFETVKTFLRITLSDNKKLDYSKECIYEEGFSKADITIQNDSFSSQITDTNNKITITAFKNNEINLFGWKNAIFLVELPEEIINFEIKNVRISNNKVTILSYELIEKDNKHFIKIYTQNELPEGYQIEIEANLTPAPTSSSGRKEINLYAKNGGSRNYYNSAKDNYDLDNNNDTEEFVEFEYDSFNIFSPNTLLTSQYISNYDEKGSIAIAPQIAEIKPVYGLNGEAKQLARINVSVMNNYSNSIEELVLIGKIPFVGNTYAISGNSLNSEFNTTMTSDGIVVSDNLAAKATVYYSEKENPSRDKDDIANEWKTYNEVADWKKIKSYLIVQNNGEKIDVKEEYTFYYDLEVPFEGDFNKVAYNHYGAYFSLNTDQGKLRTRLEPNKVGLSFVEKYDLELNKYQKNKNKVVPGATYKISRIDDEGNSIISRTATTNENGSLYIEDLLAEYRYEIEEIISPELYDLNEEKIIINSQVDTITGDFSIEKVEGNLKNEIQIKKITDIKNKVVLNTEDEVKAIVKIVKKDKDTNEPLKNVKFLLTGYGFPENGKTIITNSLGESTIYGLRIGETYRVAETKAIGYYIDSDISFRVINNNGTYEIELLDGEEQVISTNVIEQDDCPTATITISDKKIPTYSLEITKIKHETELVATTEEIINENIDNVTYLEGVRFNLYKDTKLIGSYVTDENGKITIDGLYQYEDERGINQQYVLKEVVPKEGYTKIKDVVFTVKKNTDGKLEFIEELTEGQNSKQYTTDNSSVKLLLEDSPIFKLTKKDSETGELLENAKFAVYNIDEGTKPAQNSKGEIIGTKEIVDGTDYYLVSTDNNGELSLDLPQGLYKIVEIIPSHEKYSTENQTYYFGIGVSKNTGSNWVCEEANPLKNLNNIRILETSNREIIVAGNFYTDYFNIGDYSFKNAGRGPYSNTASAEEIDSALIKYDDNYNVEWALHFKAAGRNEIEQVFETQDGGIIVSGNAYSNLTVGETKIGSIAMSSYETGFIVKFDQDGNVIWSKSVASGMTLKCVTESKDGSFWVVGDYYKILTLEGVTLTPCGSRDTFLIKLSPNGEINDIRSFGGEEFDEFSAIVETEDGIVILGQTYGSILIGNEEIISDGERDGFLLKFNNDFELQWVTTFGSEKSDGFDFLRQLNDGNFIVGGYYNQKITLGSDDYECTGSSGIVIKFNQNGEYLTAKSLDGHDYQNIKSLETTKDGGFIVGGDFHEETTIDGISITSKGVSDGWILKFDENCKVEWIKDWGTPSNDVVYSVIERENGAYIIGGHCGSTMEFCEHTIALDFSQSVALTLEIKEQESIETNINRISRLSEENNNYIKTICDTKDGGYIVGGSFAREDIVIGDSIFTNQGNKDCVLVKYNSNNDIEWAKTFGGDADEEVTTICETSDGGYAIGGYFVSREMNLENINFGNTRNRETGFIIKIDADGNVEWGKTPDIYQTNNVESITETNENRLVVGTNIYNASYGRYRGLIIEYTKDGEAIWSVTYGNNSDNVKINSINATSDGGFLVGGEFYSFEMHFGDTVFSSKGANKDGYLLKFSKDRTIEWASQILCSNASGVKKVFETNEGKYIAAGYCSKDIQINEKIETYIPNSTFIGVYDNKGKIEKVNTYKGSADSIDRNNRGEFLIGYRDGDYGYAMKIDSNGIVEWNELIGKITSQYQTLTCFLTNGDCITALTENISNDELGYTNVSLGSIYRIDGVAGCQDIQELEVNNIRKELKISTGINEIDGIKGGTITGERKEVYERVKYGDNSTKEIVITPEPNYEIISIMINEEEWQFEPNDDGSYTMPVFENVTKDIDVVAQFALKDNKIVINKIDSISNEPLIGAEFELKQIDERTEPEDSIIGSLTNNGTYSFSYVDGKYISTNEGIDSSTCNSYIPIDLTGLEGKYIITVNAEISTQSGDYGYVTANKSKTAPAYNAYSGENHRLMSISGNTAAKDYSAEVEAGDIVYLHFGYYKNATTNTSGDDRFTINSISIRLGSFDPYIVKVQTNSAGKAITQIPFGKYLVTENKAPEGYFVNDGSETIEFRSYDGAQHEFTIEDERVNKVIVHHYIKGTTTKIVEDEILEGRVGEEYISYPSVDVTQYELEKIDGKEVLPSNRVGEFIYGDQEVTYYYVAMKLPVRVNHYIEDTIDPVPLKNGENASSTVIMINENEEYNTSPIPQEELADEYELVGVPENANGYMTGEGVEVNYYYRRIVGNLIINKIDTDTKEPMQGVKFEVYENNSTIDLEDAENIGNIYEKLIADKGQAIAFRQTIIPDGNATFVDIDGKIVPENSNWYINNYSHDSAKRISRANAYLDIDLTGTNKQCVVSLNLETSNENDCELYLRDFDNHDIRINGNRNETQEIVLDGGEQYHLYATYYVYNESHNEDYASIKIEAFEALNTRTIIVNDKSYYTDYVADYDQELSFTKELCTIDGTTPFIEEDGKYIPANCQKYIDDNENSSEIYESYYSMGYIPIDLTNKDGRYIIEIDAEISGATEYDELYCVVSDSIDNSSYYSESISLRKEENGTYKIWIDGGRQYYLLMQYHKDSTEVKDYACINDVRVYKGNEVEKEYGFEKTADGKYISNIQDTFGKVAHSVIPIDLREKDGDFVLTINAEMDTNRENYGRIYVTDSIIDHNSNNVEVIAELSGKVAAKDYKMELYGGKLYYLHFSFEKGWYSNRIDTLTINNIDVKSKNSHTLTTNKNGQAEIELPTGSYIIKEIETLEGYNLLDDIVRVRINKENNNVEIENEKTKGNVIIHYCLEETGESIAPDTTLKGVIGEEYEIYDDVPSQYLIINGEDKIGTFNEGTKEVTLYYKVRDAKLIIDHKDKATGEVLAPRDEIDTKYLAEFNLESFIKDIDEYIVDREFKDETIIIDEAYVIKTIYYETKSTIRVHHQDIDTQDEIDLVELNGYIGEEIETYPINIDGYILKESPENPNVIVETDVKDVYYYYKKLSSGVLEKHIDIDEEPNRLLYEELHTGEIGEKYSIESKTFDRYELVEEELPDNATGEMTDKLIEVLFKYKYLAKVTIRYVDAETNEDIEEPIVKEGYIGDTYTSEQKDKDKYEFLRVEGNPEGEMTREDITVTYYYHRIPNKVIINYIDVSSDDPLSTKEQTKYEGEEYETEPINLEEYDLIIEQLPPNGSGEMGNEDIIVNYYYIRKAQVNVEYINFYTGNPITQNNDYKGHVGEEYETIAEEIPGYRLVKNQYPSNATGTMTKDPITVTYYYVKEATVKERHVYKDTVLYEETHSGLEGDEYDIAPRKFDDYILDDDNMPSNAKGEMGQDETVVTFRYVEKATVIEKHIDEDTKEILAYEKHEGKIGDRYDITSRKFDGYDTMYAQTENNRGEMTKEPIEVIFWYKKAAKQEVPAEDKPNEQPAPAPVTVIIVDDGKQIEQSTSNDKVVSNTANSNVVIKNVTSKDTIKPVESNDKVKNVPDTESDANRIFYAVAAGLVVIGIAIIVVVAIVNKKKGKEDK